MAGETINKEYEKSFRCIKEIPFNTTYKKSEIYGKTNHIPFNYENLADYPEYFAPYLYTTDDGIHIYEGDIEKETVYIAGAIGDDPEHIYKPRFEQGKRELASVGFSPISPVDLPHNHDRRYTSFMKEDLIAMLKCDHVYALTNWRHSPGAREEIRIATFCGLNIIHQKA